MRRDFYTYSLFSLPSPSGSAPLIETSTIVRNAGIKRQKVCLPTLVSCSMIAKVVAKDLDRSQEIVAFSALTAQGRARLCKPETAATSV